MNIIFLSDICVNYYVDPGDPILYINGTGKTTKQDVSTSCVISDIQKIVFEGEISEIGDSSFQDFINLVNISFVETITKIGQYAFAGCRNLVELVLPNSVEIIYDYAMSRCDKLTKIRLSRNLQSVSTGHLIAWSTKVKEIDIVNGVNFWVNQNKTVLIKNVTAVMTVFEANTITIPKEVEIVGSYIMIDRQIDEIIFEKGSRLHTLDSYCFSQSGLKRIVFPNGLKKITLDPFEKCQLMEYVYIPGTIVEFHSFFSVFPSIVELNESCVSLGKDEVGAIYNRDRTELVYFPPSLENFTMGPKIKTFCGKALRTAKKLTQFSVDPQNEIFSSYLNNLYNKTQKIFLGYSGGLTEVIISDKCEVIDSFSFSRGSVERVVLGENTTTINIAAFEHTRNLKEIVFSPNLRTIGSYAFTNSTLVNASITPPSSLTTFSSFCFRFTLIRSINLSSCRGVKMIGEFTFYQCYNLETAILPPELTQIQPSAFAECYSLKNISFPNTLTKLSEKAFMSCSSLECVEFNDCAITTIPRYCFYGSSIVSAVIPNSVGVLEQGSFENCGELLEFEIKDESGVEVIQPSVLSGCSKLWRISIGLGVKEIAVRAFSEMDNLKVIEVSEENSNYSSRDNALYNKEGTILICFPGGLDQCNVEGDVEEFAEYAFYKCQKLETITMSASLPLRSIASFTFSGCISLTSITIPQKTEKIFDDAFMGCINLSRVELSEGSILEEISSGSFRGCSALKSVRFGAKNKLRVISSGAFKGCKMLKDFQLPLVIEEIGSRAFEDCISIESLYFSHTIKTIGADAFRGCVGIQIVSYCYNFHSPKNRDFSTRAFSDTNVKCVLSTPESDNTFCGIPVLRLLDYDCQMPSHRFTWEVEIGKPTALSVSHLNLALGGNDEENNMIKLSWY